MVQKSTKKFKGNDGKAAGKVAEKEKGRKKEEKKSPGRRVASKNEGKSGAKNKDNRKP